MTRRLAVLAIAVFLGAPSARAGASATELVREAHQHEAAHDDQVAFSRYTDALALDPTLGEAYLGLAALRLHTGDAREADRVYSVALAHVPSLAEAIAGRADARRVLGFREAADADMESYLRARGNDVPAMKKLATWYGQDERVPAALATWRRIRAAAREQSNEALAREAQTMVRALELVVGQADPVAAPQTNDPVRRGLASIARRGRW